MMKEANENNDAGEIPVSIAGDVSKENVKDVYDIVTSMLVRKWVSDILNEDSERA